MVSGIVGKHTAIELMKEGLRDFVMKEELERLPVVVKRELEEATNRRARSQVEGRYINLVDNALVGVYQTNFKGEILFANQTMAQMLGFKDAAEMIGTRVVDRYKNLQDRERLLALLKKDGLVPNFEVELLTSDGQTKTVLLNAWLENEHISGMIMDISERKQAEEELRFHSEIMRTMAEGVYTIRASDGVITYANPTFEHMFGYEPGELIGKHVSIVNVPGDKSPEATANEIINILRRTGAWSGEVHNIRKDGTTFWCFASVSAFEHLEHGSVWVAVHEDITERKLAEQEAQLLLKLSQTIAKAEDFDSALTVTLHTICEGAGWDFGEVWIPSHDGTHLELGSPYYCRFEDMGSFRSVSEGFEFAPGIDLPGRVWTSRSPAWIPDVTVDANFPRAHFAKEVGLKAAVGIPILADDIVVAIVDFFLREARQEDERMVTLVSAVAAQLGTAFQRKRAEEKIKRQLQRLAALHKIDQAITSSVDLQLALKVVLDQTIGLLGVDAATVLLLNPHLQTLEYSAGRGFRGKGIERSRLRLGEGHAGRSALERQMLHIPDLTQPGTSLSRTSLQEDEGFVSYCCAPLIAKGQVKGVIEVFQRSPMYSIGEWKDFLETLAGQAAIAVDNTQLFDSLQRS
ncbi:MAG: PAS domain S-box protein, partial [Anaerolineaceae bacterium]|nr:PAS domain S-box protein [Anaerolineaceae bacterium]